ncbi:MAG: hypothetical protein KJI71_00550 [Patescibacteria group bacterium]|nr:hypothetical protein [Patescibacteria group bacterium]
MSLWLNIVKRRLTTLQKKVMSMIRTERFGVFMDIARNYRLLEIQMEIEAIRKNNSYS